MLIASSEVALPPESHHIQTPTSLYDGLLIAIPSAIYLIVFGCKELIQLRVRQKTQTFQSQIERQKADQEEKSDRIDYLEKQNEMLLTQILSLRRMINVQAAEYENVQPHSS